MSGYRGNKTTDRQGASFAEAKRATNAPLCKLVAFAKAASLTAVFTLLPLNALVTTASAASEDVRFRADLSAPNACSIVVVRDGDFGVSADKRVLSSKLIGGQSAIADVFSGQAYDVTAIPVNYFTLGPSGANLNTTFEGRFSGIDISRGRTFAERSGTLPVRLRTGTSITRLNVHMIATRTGSSFPGGAYEGTVVVRCE